MKIIRGFIARCDAATVFVVIATIGIILEISFMRLLVPVTATADNDTEVILMGQVYTDASVATTKNKLAVWNQDSASIVEASTMNTTQWQKNLDNRHVFSFESSVELAHAGKVNEKEMQITAANYAAGQLYLQSVMTGRTPLANINGIIYKTGDTIPVRGGEIVMLVTEVGSDYAKIQLADYKDIERTLYISKDMQSVHGVRHP